MGPLLHTEIYSHVGLLHQQYRAKPLHGSGGFAFCNQLQITLPCHGLSIVSGNRHSVKYVNAAYASRVVRQEEIDDGRHHQTEHHGDGESTDDRDGQRLEHLRALA